MHHISIKFKPETDQNALFHTFWSLLGFLRHNGQLLGRHLEPYVKDGQISATFLTVTAEALDEKYHNVYVRSGIEKLEALCGNSLIIKHVGYGENEQTAVCNCSTHPYFLMMYHREYAPIVCGNCNKIVPLHTLPKLQDFGYWTLTNWQSAYMACVMLDLNCGTGEKWAIRQQCQHDSGLAKQGIEVARRIAETTGVKTYYYLANYAKRSKVKDRARPCPSCGGAWHLATEIHGYVRHKCDKCLLMSSYSNNLR
jgi:predicted  nucleic acid-binding Zn ribbon protein